MNRTLVCGVVVGMAAVTGLCTDAAAQKPKVALVAAASSSITACQFVDPQAKLMATGLFDAVDIIHAGQVTPTLAELLAYDSVMTWSNTNYANSAALGDVLADYVDAGGGVVVTVFANSTTTANRFLTGRWITDGYEIIPSQGGSTSTASGIGTVVDPGHPIMQGVGAFNGTFRPTTTALTSHGVKIAEWLDGKTLVAVSDKFPNRADLGFYPPSSACSAAWWTGSGAELMANALIYTGAGQPTCYPDCDGNGQLNIDDFICFQLEFALQTPYADCDGNQVHNIDDFICFQLAFALGC